MSTTTPANPTTSGPPESNRVRIFDTTLRDGEQSPGASMNMAEKLELARALAALGVDVIEAGFPIASVGDFEAVRAIATEVAGSSVCGLARCNERDIDRAWEAIQYAQSPRIHVFLATSAIHREHKLRMTRSQIVEKAVAERPQGRGVLPGRRVQPRGRRADRARLPLRGRRGGHRGRRHHGEHPRHRRLRDAPPVRHGDPHAEGARAQHRPGGHQHALPRRPRPGGRQQPRGLRGRRAAGRVHDQRHRRARRQRRARGGRHGASRPASTISA